MTTLPFDCHLPLGIFIECEVTGSVSTDDGTSEPYFKVYAIRIDGQAYQVGGMYSKWERDTLDLIADKAATDTDILADAMRIEEERGHIARLADQSRSISMGNAPSVAEMAAEIARLREALGRISRDGAGSWMADAADDALQGARHD